MIITTNTSPVQDLAESFKLSTPAERLAEAEEEASGLAPEVQSSGGDPWGFFCATREEACLRSRFWACRFLAASDGISRSRSLALGGRSTL